MPVLDVNCLIRPVLMELRADPSLGLLIVSTLSISAVLAEIWKMDVLLSVKETMTDLIINEEKHVCIYGCVCVWQAGWAPRESSCSASVGW